MRGLTVRSAELGIWGKCDVVEFHRDAKGHPLAGEDGLWRAIPVEYKRGRSKADDTDRVQLCAQAMCLEEMLGLPIEYGCLYYGSTHSREHVTLSEDLRSSVRSALAEMHLLYDHGYVPKVRKVAHCRACSLVDLCVPKASFQSVDDYIRHAFEGMDAI